MKRILFAHRVGGGAADLGLLVLRVFAGASLAIAHGWGKVYPSGPSEGFVGMIGGLGLPEPELLAWLSGLTELVGGALLAVGLLTRPAALAVAVNMAVAGLWFHQVQGDPYSARELALFYLAAAFCLLLTGPGRISLDRALGGGEPVR